ncbi:MAG: SLBB domain-containing protein [Elusimicrobiota bacterium]
MKVIGFIIFFGIVGAGGWLYEEGRLKRFIDTYLNNTAPQPDQLENKFVNVTVRGEVKKPGTYKINRGATLGELVKKAGGFTRLADYKQLDLNFKIEQNMLIAVPENRSLLKRIGVGEAPEETYIDPPVVIEEK